MSLRSKQEYYNSERDNEVLMFLKFSFHLLSVLSKSIGDGESTSTVLRILLLYTQWVSNEAIKM